MNDIERRIADPRERTRREGQARGRILREGNRVAALRKRQTRERLRVRGRRLTIQRQRTATQRERARAG